MPRPNTRLLRWLAGTCAALALAGCDRSGPAPVASGASVRGPRFHVVAAENFWGSIAAQLAGTRATVTSIIVNPETDPHSYQPSASDARTIANSNMAIVNGVGYDEWARQLLAASASPSRVVLDVGQLLHLPEGSNPHRWYFPADVLAVVGAIVSDYERLDPADAAYFAARREAFLDGGLARYRQLIAQIRERYAGTPVGYSESIFQGLGQALGLRLRTPYSFVRAIAEGTDVTAQDKETVDHQAEARDIDVWVLNSQNVTPDVQRVDEIARARGIPIATITETLDPPRDSFQQWQVSELEGIERALERGTAR